MDTIYIYINIHIYIYVSIYIYIWMDGWMDGCIERERERSGGVTVKVVQRMRQKPNPGEQEGRCQLEALSQVITVIYIFQQNPGKRSVSQPILEVNRRM